MFFLFVNFGVYCLAGLSVLHFGVFCASLWSCNLRSCGVQCCFLYGSFSAGFFRCCLVVAFYVILDLKKSIMCRFALFVSWFMVPVLCGLRAGFSDLLVCALCICCFLVCCVSVGDCLVLLICLDIFDLRWW